MCNCATKQRQLKANLLAGEAKRTTYEGRPTLIVPVVMARADVVMNGGIIPAEEMVPYAWNGVPVTVGHPQSRDGAPLQANDPQVLAEWSVGRVFGAKVVNGTLKAEAWIDIAKANKVYSGLVQQLMAGENIDVSTGYFCTPVEATGNAGGRAYSEIHRNLRPEHLALLPGEEGACSWEDGCGVRANLKEAFTMKLDEAVAALRKAVDGMATAVLRTNSKKNARGSDDDRRQIMADLISSDDSPFTPEDEAGMSMLSEAALRSVRDKFYKREEPEPPKTKPEDTEANEGDEEDKEKKDMKANAAAIKAAVDAAMKDTVKAAVAEALKANALSDDDKAALADAKKAREDRKANLVAKVVANSSIKKEDAEKMDFATLETVANGLLPAPIYGGRAAPVTNADNDDEDVKAMSEFNGDDAFTNALNAKRERLNKKAA